MTNEIIIGVLIVLVFIGLRSSAKHFQGKGGCCGGGSEVKVKRKHLKHIVKQRMVHIEGMTCEHCKNRVENRLNELAGVSAKVDLKKKLAVISMETEVSNDRIIEIITKAGYEVVGIE